MSGHARMVPQGHHMLKKVLERIPDCHHDVFSMLWTDGDHKSGGVSVEDPATTRILEGLGPRLARESQMQKLRYLRERFVRDGDIDEKMLELGAFRRATGQIWGFLHALDLWRNELAGYDAIIRSRWDRVLDADCINAVLNRRYFRGGPNEWLITCDVSVNEGQLYYSGDAIYGPARKWLELIPSEEVATTRCISAVRRWYVNNVDDPRSLLYRCHEKWFTSHWLWTTIFDGADISMAGLGNCLAIDPALADLPVEQLNEDLISRFPVTGPGVASWTDPVTGARFFYSLCDQDVPDTGYLEAWLLEKGLERGRSWEMTRGADGRSSWHFEQQRDYNDFMSLLVSQALHGRTGCMVNRRVDSEDQKI